MGIPLGRQDLRMPEQFADDGQAMASIDAETREGVPKVVDSHIRNPCLDFDPLPDVVEGGAVGAGLVSWDDVGVVRQGLEALEYS